MGDERDADTSLWRFNVRKACRERHASPAHSFGKYVVTFEGIDTQVTRVFKNRETKSETHAFVPATFLDIYGSWSVNILPENKHITRIQSCFEILIAYLWLLI